MSRGASNDAVEQITNENVSTDLPEGSYVIEREKCISTVQRLQNTLQYSSGNKIFKSGAYKWTVPTSVFIGLRPTAIKDPDFVDESGRKFIRFTVENKVENRAQSEEIREDKFTGVIFRGNDNFGWASRKLKEVKNGWGDEIHFEVLNKVEDRKMFKGQYSKAGTDKFWETMIQELKDHCNEAQRDPKAFFDESHLEQLYSTDIVLLRKTLQSLFQPFWERHLEYEVLIATYGGGVKRFAVSFDSLKAKLEESNEMKCHERSTRYYVHEMRDGSVSTFDDESDAIIGYEESKNGQLKYIRVAFGDTSSDLEFASIMANV